METTVTGKHSALLRIENVIKNYSHYRAIDRVSFEVHRGQIVGLLGPNGAGKTTLLRMIADILRPDQGMIQLLGEPMIAGFQNRIGYLPEERGLYQNRKIIDVLVFLARLKGLTHAQALQAANSYLEKTHLKDVCYKKMRELSKGMQQKLLIAAVLQHEPDLIILDEPFIGLDPLNRELVLNLVREAVTKGAGVLLSTHLMSQVESLCNKVLFLHRGTVVLTGSVQSIREHYSDNTVCIECDYDLPLHPDVIQIEGSKATLRTGVSGDQFLLSLLTKGIHIRHFSRSLPSLDAVFLQVIKSHEESLARRYP